MKEILERRSVRKFREGAVSEEDMTRLLTAAMRAPSAVNEQPWEFVVVRKRESMLKITEFHPYAGMLREADCAVLVCGNTDLQKVPGYDFWVQDCSAATQNLLLEAVHLGLGGVWLGVHPLKERVKDLQQLFGLPDAVIPLCIVALGYPAEQCTPLDTYKPERVHREKW